MMALFLVLSFVLLVFTGVGPDDWKNLINNIKE